MENHLRKPSITSANERVLPSCCVGGEVAIHRPHYLHKSRTNGRRNCPSRRSESAERGRLCHACDGELEQIQFCLAKASVQKTERYIGSKQKLQDVVNDRLEFRSQVTAHEKFIRCRFGDVGDSVLYHSPRSCEVARCFAPSFVRVGDNPPAGPGKHYGVTRENSLILPL